jgi:hypothetical protein
VLVSLQVQLCISQAAAAEVQILVELAGQVVLAAAAQAPMRPQQFRFQPPVLQILVAGVVAVEQERAVADKSPALQVVLVL